MLSSSDAPVSIAAGHLMASGGGPSPLWYTTRATGVVALILLTLTVAFGVAGTARYSSEPLPRMVSAGLHRNLSLLTVAFVATHIATTLADPFVNIGIVSSFVPFTSSYRPFWLSLGAIAFDLLLALVITSLLRTRLSYRAWRAIHWLAYASWPIALWHGLGTGTDTRLPVLLAVDVLCLAAVAAAAGWRLSLAGPGPLRTAGITVLIGIPLATAAFTL